MKTEYLEGKKGSTFLALFHSTSDKEPHLRITSGLTIEGVETFVAPPEGYRFIGLCGGIPHSLEEELALLSGVDDDIPIFPFLWCIEKSKQAGIPEDVEMRKAILKAIIAEKDIRSSLSVASLAVRI